MSERRERLGAWTAAAAAGLGLVASAALLVDSLAAAPTFCAEGGCAVVRASGWARPLGVPMPTIGLGFFALVLALTLAGPRAARARTAMAVVGGVGALGLVTLQGAVIGAWCRYCLVADGAALALAAAILLGDAPRWPRRRGATWVGAAAMVALAIGVPVHQRDARRPAAVTTARADAALPPVIARAQRPGVVTVVDFVDFECPYCRVLHGRLVEAMARAGVPTRVVRKMTPLVRLHPGAMAAAIAWCCAERQGRGDAMADALIAAPPADLTDAGCERLAAGLGLDLARYRVDAADPAIRARIDADLADARAVGARALPTLYIGGEVVVGAGATVDDLVASLRRAAA
ncbi:MAG: vitamin K epoxide reductase family protein [Kofleriaceae bacterium]